MRAALCLSNVVASILIVVRVRTDACTRGTALQGGQIRSGGRRWRL